MSKCRKYYPAFIELEGRRCVVVGGGRIAERKVMDLLEAGAHVIVVSPTLTDGLQRLKDDQMIEHTARKAAMRDLKGAFLAVAATDNMEDNVRVSRMAGQMLVNVVDKPDLCNFIVPSRVKRGPLTIAVSTSGTSPAMARAIREDIERIYGPQFGRYLEKISRLRAQALERIEDPAEREEFLKSLASADIVRALRENRAPALPKLPPKKRARRT